MTTAAAIQRVASDPRASAFVSAHAGTGKTKLLVDRLLRLMLAGADPARILCLTYTKAAAAEMAIRLQRVLGGWVMMDDALLEGELAALDIGPDAVPLARQLFARVLDLPGGMRIGTIHAFCQSLLKRFPLEARISPHFRLMEPEDARAALEQAREAVLPDAEAPALAALAGLVNADGFALLAANLEKARERLALTQNLSPEGLRTAMMRAAGAVHEDEAALLQNAVSWADEPKLRRALALVAEGASDSIRPKGERMLQWLALPPDLRAEHFDAWVEEFFRPDGEPRGLGVFANKKFAEVNRHVIPLCEAEQARLASVLDGKRALKLAAASAALLRLSAPMIEFYAQGKARRALLDYDDLITRTHGLLQDEAVGAAWVLFKLDGGLDHLLLDEVQDTAPAQWLIADRLTAEFFAGEGARDEVNLPRTVFAVGDRKQSIYSFQGADPEKFDFWRGVFGGRVEQAGRAWRDVTLQTSFRSAEPVLALVDAVFSQPAARAGVCLPGEILRHQAHRTGHAGRVEIWPKVPRAEPPPHTPWSIPLRNQAQISAPQTLVNHLAAWIAQQTDGSTPLPSAGRPLRPGDILVLVRRRGEFDRALVRALKAAGVPVAGLDRMMLVDQPAVQDLLSLCEALLLPQDDLSFSEMLVSPLGGLTDESLMHLAAQRPGSVWDALRSRAGERPEWQAAAKFFSALLARVDYAPPYALLSEALGPLGGRANLFARLGPEAAEPVDEFLNAALLHAASHPPSLQGFLHWLRQSAAEVKREAEAAGDSVRIMTVHGAKGLEAPLVILPDTTSLPPDERGLCWAQDEESGAHLPLWQPNKDFRCAAVESLRDAQAQKRAQEYNRLLYVALTRARDRVLVCGWEVRQAQEGCWYDLVAAGMKALSARADTFGAWPGQIYVVETPQANTPETRAKTLGAAPPEKLPAWAGCAPDWRPAPLAAEPALPRPLAPSRPEGIGLGKVPAARSPLAQPAPADRFSRGLAMHALLEHLPDFHVEARREAAHRYAARPELGLADPAALAEAALAVLDMPGIEDLFGPGSRAEQKVAGVAGGQVISGQVDRLAILPDRVLIADYKTGVPPADAASVPVLYLRQMAAYRALLALLYPNRPQTCVLIWTDGPTVMILPPALLDRHAPGAAPQNPA